MKTADQPFEFLTASYLTRIGNQKATNLNELRDGLDHCGDASIFYHTFQTLQRHHFLTERFSNDFTQWHSDLAERLGAQGHEHVREQFLVTSDINRHLALFLHLLGTS